jgi:hypothetical protein
MVGAGLACSAGAMLCGEGGVVASSGRGGGKGGDSALGALEARSWKASTMVVMRNARKSLCATQSLCGSTLIHRALVSANSSSNRFIRGPRARQRLVCLSFFSHLCFGFLIVGRGHPQFVFGAIESNMILAGHGRVEAATLPTMANVPCVLAETMTPAAIIGWLRGAVMSTFQEMG